MLTTEKSPLYKESYADMESIKGESDDKIHLERNLCNEFHLSDTLHQVLCYLIRYRIAAAGTLECCRMRSEERIKQDLDALNQAYNDKRLRLLVGAGASVRANFPSWEALDLRLLTAFLRKDLQQTDTKYLQLLSPILPNISKQIYEKLKGSKQWLKQTKENRSV